MSFEKEKRKNDHEQRKLTRAEIVILSLLAMILIAMALELFHRQQQISIIEQTVKDHQLKGTFGPAEIVLPDQSKELLFQFEKTGDPEVGFLLARFLGLALQKTQNYQEIGILTSEKMRALDQIGAMSAVESLYFDLIAWEAGRGLALFSLDEFAASNIPDQVLQVLDTIELSENTALREALTARDTQVLTLALYVLMSLLGFVLYAKHGQLDKKVLKGAFASWEAWNANRQKGAAKFTLPPGEKPESRLELIEPGTQPEDIALTDSSQVSPHSQAGKPQSLARPHLEQE